MWIADRNSITLIVVYFSTLTSENRLIYDNKNGVSKIEKHTQIRNYILKEGQKELPLLNNMNVTNYSCIIHII